MSLPTCPGMTPTSVALANARAHFSRSKVRNMKLAAVFVLLLASVAADYTLPSSVNCAGTTYTPASGLCCSNYGYPGNSSAYCGVGSCAGGSCGLTGCHLTGCPTGQCCSQYGYCGASAGYCDPANRCFSKCWAAAPSCSPVYVAYFANYKSQYGANGGCGFIPEMILPTQKYTHINWAFASFDGSTGIIADLSAYDANMVSRLIALKANNTALKIIVSLGGGGFGSAPWTNLMGSASAQNAFFSGLKAWILKYKFDGIDIDWEFPTSGQTALVATFFQKARAAIGNDLLLTAATGNKYYNQFYAPENWIQYVNFLNVMNYDYYYGNGGVTGSDAPLYGQQNSGSINATINDYFNRDVPAHKLVFGLRNYGYIFAVNSNTPTTGMAFSGLSTYKTQCAGAGSLSAIDVTTLLTNSTKSATQFSVQWDDSTKSAFATWPNNYATFETTASIKAKVDYIKDYGLGGAMLWILDSDSTIADYIGKQLNW
ncbi:hypothetical protein PROFUN_10403 [Planoprotostelium fungivorum]|uniref:Uncharacterized protein n=1 Tax=Planoprotostelium fungivorum TaxID=1890364 RepID=A0A2P6NE07_9EUKA|nr:hypothetical protein PROFUN_10403 [Planoprotostelium fungivorum]